MSGLENSEIFYFYFFSIFWIFVWVGMSLRALEGVLVCAYVVFIGF